jgi:hypothetical protein
MDCSYCGYLKSQKMKLQIMGDIFIFISIPQIPIQDKGRHKTMYMAQVLFIQVYTQGKSVREMKVRVIVTLGVQEGLLG